MVDRIYPTDLPIKNQAWISREIYDRLSHGWYGIFVETLSINFLEEVWMTSLFVFVPFCWVSVHIQVENRSLLWGLWSFKMDGWEDENRVTHILFIQLAWYQHDTESDVVEDMLCQVNLLSISWYRLQQFLLGCVCGVLLCLQQFSKSLKTSLGGARLIALPISIVHVNCRGVEHILNLMLFLIDIFRQNRVTEIKSCLTTFKLITQNRQIQERCYPPKPRNEPGDSFQHIPSSIGTKKTFNNLYRYILLCFFRWNI